MKKATEEAVEFALRSKKGLEFDEKKPSPV